MGDSWEVRRSPAWGCQKGQGHEGTGSLVWPPPPGPHSLCIPSILALAGFPFVGSHTSPPFNSWVYNLYLPSSLLSHLLLRSWQSGSDKNVLWSKPSFFLSSLLLENILCNSSQAVPICELLSRDGTGPPSTPVPLDRGLPKEGPCFEDSLFPQYPVSQHGD